MPGLSRCISAGFAGDTFSLGQGASALPGLVEEHGGEEQTCLRGEVMTESHLSKVAERN